MPADSTKVLRCAIYTRKSTEHGLDQEFNSLDAQREACEAYIKSQASQGWKVLPQHYDDPAYSGGDLDRPALKRLLRDVEAGRIEVVVVYKLDRLTRSLVDFAKLVETFDARSISFVAVTQQFNTTTSMGRLTLNILLSFAQFERELASERVRDKIAASRKKGKWTGGTVPLGYDTKDKKLIVNNAEADTVRSIFQRYLELKSFSRLVTFKDPSNGSSPTTEIPWMRIKAGLTRMLPMNAHRKPDQKVLQAVVRSHAWLADLKNNRHASIEELAEAVKIHPKVVRQAIRLAFLAPEVTSAILEGDHPERLTLRQIPKRLPLAWSACRELQTFDSVSYP